MGRSGRRHSLRRDRELSPCARPPQQRNVELAGEARDEEDIMQPYFQTVIESEARYHREQLANDFRRSGRRERVGVRDTHQRRFHLWRRDSS
jgi:hypothetical protein